MDIRSLMKYINEENSGEYFQVQYRYQVLAIESLKLEWAGRFTMKDIFTCLGSSSCHAKLPLMILCG